MPSHGLRMYPALLLFTLFLVSSAWAHTPLHVEWRQERLSVSAEKEPLAQILHEVARQTGMEIRGLEGLQEQVSVRFAGLPLQEGLQKLSVNSVVVWQTSPQRGWRPVLSLVSRRKVPSPPEALLREAIPSRVGTQPEEKPGLEVRRNRRDGSRDHVGTQPEGKPGLEDSQKGRLKALHALAKQGDEAGLRKALFDPGPTIRATAFSSFAEQDRQGAIASPVAGVKAGTPSAQAASFGWAYLRADQPTSPSYTPNSKYQFNSSTNGYTSNFVIRIGVGVYEAYLPNLGLVGGTVHVTAYGSGSESCKVANWFPSGSNQLVQVRCFDSAGTPVDARFTMTYAHPYSSRKPMAFLLADQPTSPSYTPNLSFQFNSSGVANTVVRNGVGAYTATLPNARGVTGHIQVTAYGWSSERCKVANWSPSGSNQLVQVRCFTSAGTPVDAQFTMTYVSGTNLVGAPPSGTRGTSSAYALAAPPYLLEQFNSSSITGNYNTLKRLGVGVYGVQFHDQPLGYGDVQVTAYGYGSEYCKVANWNPTDGVQVRCFSSSGVPVDTDFDVTILYSSNLG